MDELKLIIDNSKGADISTFSETWLTDQIEDSELNLQGYSVIRQDRQGKIGGGVAIFVRNGLQYIERKDLQN